MTTQELQEIVSKIMTRRIVTECRGSWKWQDAYRITRYCATLVINGTVLWAPCGSTRKLSRPQLGERWDDLFHGSLNRRPVPRVIAVEVLGLDVVCDIESRGWTFGKEK